MTCNPGGLAQSHSFGQKQQGEKNSVKKLEKKKASRKLGEKIAEKLPPPRNWQIFCYFSPYAFLEVYFAICVVFFLLPSAQNMALCQPAGVATFDPTPFKEDPLSHISRNFSPVFGAGSGKGIVAVSVILADFRSGSILYSVKG